MSLLLAILGTIGIIVGLVWMASVGASSGLAIVLATPITLSLIGGGLFMLALAAVLTRLDRVADEVRRLRLAVAPEQPELPRESRRREPRP